MPYNLGKVSVLVVEDIHPMLTLLVSTLGIIGIKNIAKARDGKEGFSNFQKVNPDIVITDWHMHPVDGIEMTKQIRMNAMSVNRRVPIVMMTGYSAMQRVEKARDAGVTEFLVKPFTADILAKRITTIIEKPRQFVHTNNFFGPDRRRRKDKNYKGPYRRVEDEEKLEKKGIYKV